MKLPDFLKSAALNDLKQRMGLSLETYGSFDLAIDAGRLTLEELEKLSSGEGIDVSFDQLTVLPDGTLAYKDSRVLLYIRDVHAYGGRHHEPRYHLANCAKLVEMEACGRFGRYVIAAETTGEFKLNIVSHNVSRSERRHLRVCQMCLSELRFNGFNFAMNSGSRNSIVRDFSPALFFRQYPRSLHKKKPAHTSVTAPLNNYTQDFPQISSQLRDQCGWECDECRRFFGQGRKRRFLDVHHVDGGRNNNDPTNLKVLCIECHAEQPMHAHLRNTPRFREFLREIGPL